MAIRKIDGVVRSIEKCLIGNEDFSYITYKLKINAENCIQYYVEEADVRNKIQYVFAVDNWEDVLGSPVTVCYDTEIGEVVKIGSDEEELWMCVKDLWNGEDAEPKTSEKDDSKEELWNVTGVAANYDYNQIEIEIERKTENEVEQSAELIISGLEKLQILAGGDVTWLNIDERLKCVAVNFDNMTIRNEKSSVTVEIKEVLSMNTSGTYSQMCKRSDDNINPQHYKMGAIEIIECIKSELSPEEFTGYLKGNVIKYISREAHKNGFEDVEKGKWYMDRLAKEKSDGI